MPEDRNLNQYYGETGEIIVDGITLNIYETLTMFRLEADRIQLIFQGWFSPTAFKTYTADIESYRRIFNPLISDLTQPQQTALNSLKTDAVQDVLGLNTNDFEFFGIEIDALNLLGRISAKHKPIVFEGEQLGVKNFNHWHITPEIFNSVKALHLSLFTQFTQFAWQIGKTQDSFLASLQPYSN